MSVKFDKKRYFEQKELWSDHNYWTQLQYQRARDTVGMLPSELVSVLDVGCGAGIVTRELQTRFRIVVGLDIAYTPLCYLRKFGIPSAQGDAQWLPFGDNSFDAVLSTEVIEHLGSRQRIKVLNEISRVARKFILISVPYKENLEGGHVKCAECRCIFHSNFHTATFSESDLELLFPPPWKLVQVKYLKPNRVVLPKLLIRIAHLFDGFVNFQGAVCPVCEAKQFVSSKWARRLFLSGPTLLLNHLGGRFFKIPLWVAALYSNEN